MRRPPVAVKSPPLCRRRPLRMLPPALCPARSRMQTSLSNHIEVDSIYHLAFRVCRSGRPADHCIHPRAALAAAPVGDHKPGCNPLPCPVQLALAATLCARHPADIVLHPMQGGPARQRECVCSLTASIPADRNVRGRPASSQTSGVGIYQSKHFAVPARWLACSASHCQETKRETRMRPSASTCGGSGITGRWAPTHQQLASLPPAALQG